VLPAIIIACCFIFWWKCWPRYNSTRYEKFV